MLCPLVIQHFAMENDRFQWLCQVTTGYLPHGVGPRTHCLRYPKLGYRTKAPNTKPAQFEFSENHCIFILQVSQLAVPHIYIHMYTHIYNIYIYITPAQIGCGSCFLHRKTRGWPDVAAGLRWQHCIRVLLFSSFGKRLGLLHGSVHDCVRLFIYNV